MEKTKAELAEYLSAQLGPGQLEKLEQVIRYRTKYLTVVIEDLYQPQNASSITRTCENLGIEDIHIIEMRNRFVLDEHVSQGASQWLNLIRYNEPGLNNTQLCLEKLKTDGYKIVATTPHKDDFNLDSLPVGNKFALVFGTEEKGLTSLAIDYADHFMKIPMYGFTESLNISVSLAIAAYHLMAKIRSANLDWQLSPEEMLETKLQLLKKLIPSEVKGDE
jgi:tRNA (guanosine-2'-O-)-methyltransferase